MHWIETDLEPDDVLALAILPHGDYYVVGEGEANIKYNRMLKYCEQMNNTNAIVIQGHGSTKLFQGGGAEFDDLSSLACDQKYIDHFVKFSMTPNATMFCLKPMRELLCEYIANPVLIKTCVSRIELYVYGGFNFRCLLQKYETELLELLKSFKKVCIYESYYATGESNSVNKQNFPKLYDYIMANSHLPYYKSLLRLTYNWNVYLKNDQIVSLQKYPVNSEPYKRTQKMIESIGDNETFQYVLADFGLAAVYREIEPIPVSNLRFENQYTKFDITGENTNIYVYQNIDKKIIEDLIINQKIQ